MNQHQLDTIRQAINIQNLFIEVHPHWASDKEGHRAQIRQAARRLIEQERGSLDPNHAVSETTLKSELETLDDLSQIPQLSVAHLSLSHCPKAGGFAVCDPQHRIGLDIEDPSRAHENVVQRMSSEDELSKSPSPCHLWVAKEAVYKSLIGPLQPSVLSAVTIRQWFPLTTEIWVFRAAAPGLKEGAGEGCILPKLGTIVGIFGFPV